MDWCKNNLKKLSTTKVDCMKKFYECLKKHERNTINFEKKKIKLLTDEKQETYQNANICYICCGIFENKSANKKIS